MVPKKIFEIYMGRVLIGLGIFMVNIFSFTQGISLSFGQWSVDGVTVSKREKTGQDIDRSHDMEWKSALKCSEALNGAFAK